MIALGRGADDRSPAWQPIYANIEETANRETQQNEDYREKSLHGNILHGDCRPCQDWRRRADSLSSDQPSSVEVGPSKAFSELPSASSSPNSLSPSLLKRDSSM